VLFPNVERIEGKTLCDISYTFSCTLTHHYAVTVCIYLQNWHFANKYTENTCIFCISDISIHFITKIKLQAYKIYLRFLAYEYFLDSILCIHMLSTS
jgi:hypothetical protein